MTLVNNNYQIGQSLTAANNFTLVSDGAGGVKLARGNAGATTQDILSVNAAGVVTLLKPPIITATAMPAFRARKSGTQSVPNNVDTLLLWDTNDWNDGTAFQTNGFLPLVAGLYLFTWRVRATPASGTFSDIVATLRLNGAGVASGSNTLGASATAAVSSGSAIVKMNGTTDAVDLSMFQTNSASGNATVLSGAALSSWEGCLLKAL